MPLNLVREQADHSSLAMTNIYMGDSGGRTNRSNKSAHLLLMRCAGKFQNDAWIPALPAPAIDSLHRVRIKVNRIRHHVSEF
ncbi:MAG TPA: hypothetical protein IAC04_04695 [Candidatus Coprenecus stercoravium]|uniref:Uncharacterized protein n=1 Tax=Candidatus Coprenecus stercoravium TaxID=2840735 RepID=A0A9D2GR80_9BACT|nr:hypothetical protein [Candidatus Coprenecus stercoravium]